MMKERDEHVLTTVRPGSNVRIYKPPHFNKHNDEKLWKIKARIKPKYPKLKRYDKGEGVVGFMKITAHPWILIK